MPEEDAIERAREDEREGLSPSTQAGEFVREEMEHIREGEHGARSPEQAIAIGLSKARQAGVKLPPPKAVKCERNVKPSAISRRAAHAVAKNLHANARGQPEVRSNARATGQHRKKRCRDRRSGRRVDARRGHVRPQQRKPRARENAVARTVRRRESRTRKF